MPELGSRRRAEDIGERWPELPEWATPDELDPEVRRDLRGLSREGSEFVAGHLVAAGALADEDPELAWRHARAARTRGGRIAVVRETVGLVAYRAGEWAEAIGELRAARRMSGGAGHLAVLADCERALGNPERAIELSRSPEAEGLDAEQRTELVIVAAGARADLGQTDAAVAQLEQLAAANPASARVAFAYADLLAQSGRREDAITWFIKAADADIDEETDAAARLVELGADAEQAPTPASTNPAVTDDVTEPAVGTVMHSAADDGIAASASDREPGADSDDEPNDRPASAQVTSAAADPAADAARTDATAIRSDDAGGPTDRQAQQPVTGPVDDADAPGSQSAAEVEEHAVEAVESTADESDADGSDADGSDADKGDADADQVDVAETTSDPDDDDRTDSSFSGSPLFSDNPTTGA